MMKRKTFLCAIIFLISSSNILIQSAPHNSNFICKISGHKYDKMSIFIVGEQFRKEISGIKSNKNTWTFIIPDSLYERHLYIETFGFNDTIKSFLSFNNTKNTLSISNVTFTPNHKLEICYKDSKTVLLPNIENGKLIKKKRLDDDYDITTSDPEAQAYLTLFPFLMKDLNEDDTLLQEYLLVSQQYRDTRYAAANIYRILENNKHRNIISALYNTLSLKQQESYFGLKIKRFLALETFPQLKLPEVVNGIPQNIIKEKRYNFIVFSTSWCGPCHKLVPLLKEVYNNLQQYSFDMTYISMDESSTVNDWDLFMKKNEIPWKSYLAYQQINEIQQTFGNFGYPTSFLVYPDGHFIPLDIRNEKDLKELYNIVCHKN